MKIIEQSYEILTDIDGDKILKNIERIARICYKSEAKITNESAQAFVKMLINLGHEAMLEHESISVKLITDRGVSHELVRHRLCSFAQESTRYCNYRNTGGITVIIPVNIGDNFDTWRNAMEYAERAYLNLISAGISPQIARSVLPNSLKTEIIVTANLREWRHILKLRVSPFAHPQIRELLKLVLEEFKIKIPIVFDDIWLT